MKKLYLLSLLVVVLGLASCNDDEPSGGGAGMIYDFGPIEFFIDATDGEHDLLDPEYAGNICKEVSISYNGKIYEYTPSSKLQPKHYLPNFYGLKLRMITRRLPDNTGYYDVYVFTFGEFDYTKKFNGETFYINWPKGIKDKVKWNHKLIWKNGKPEARSEFYLNGKKLQGPYISRKF